MADQDNGQPYVSLLPTGFKKLDEGRGQLSELLQGEHQSSRYVFIGSPYHVLPDETKMPKDYEGDPMWFPSTEEPLGLQLPQESSFTSFRTLKRGGTIFKPGWASALAQAKGHDAIGDLGTGKLSYHDREGAILPDGYFEDKTPEELEAIMAQRSGVPVYATGGWRERPEGPPAGATLLSQQDEAMYTARSVQGYVKDPFTLVEMGKGSTQLVTFRE